MQRAVNLTVPWVHARPLSIFQAVINTLVRTKEIEGYDGQAC